MESRDGAMLTRNQIRHLGKSDHNDAVTIGIIESKESSPRLLLDRSFDDDALGNQSGHISDEVVSFDNRTLDRAGRHLSGTT